MWIIPHIPLILFLTCIIGSACGWTWYWLYDTPNGEIWRLKRRAKRIYCQLESIRDEFSCDISLIREIAPEYRDLENEFSEVLMRLRTLDPKYPREEYR